MRQIIAEIEGLVPLLMHSGGLVDPMNEYARAVGKLAKSRRGRKSEADYEEMARIEFFGGLYIGKDGPFIPGENIEAMLVAAARVRRLGKTVAAVVACHDLEVRLEYQGPRTAEALWADARFRHAKPARVSSARVMRMRPQFREWRAEFTISYDERQIEEDTVRELLEIAGTQIGLGDWRPRYGRFRVLSLA